MRYRPAEDSGSPLLQAARQKLTRHPQPPASLKVPARLDGRLQCFTAKAGSRELLILMDNSVPPRLCIDTDFDGNLAGEQRVVGRPMPDGGRRDDPTDGTDEAGRGRFRFGPMSYSTAGGEVQILIEGNARQGFTLFPARYREGSLDQDGRAYRIALVDCEMDGRFDRAICPGSDPPFSGASDWIAIDQNGNGQFDLVPSGRWEIQPLTPVWAFGKSYYEAKVEPDGSAVHLRPIKPRLGVLDVGSSNSGLLVVGPNGILHLEGGGKWWLPEGPYRCVSIRLWHMDARTKVIWALASTGDTQALKGFRVDADRPLTVPVGSALTARDSGAPVEETRLVSGSLLADEANIEYKVLEGSSGSASEPPRELARVPYRRPVWPKPRVMFYRPFG